MLEFAGSLQPTRATTGITKQSFTTIKLSDFPNNKGLQTIVTQVQLLYNLA